MRVRIGGEIAIWSPGIRSAASRSLDNSAKVRERSSGQITLNPRQMIERRRDHRVMRVRGFILPFP